MLKNNMKHLKEWWACKRFLISDVLLELCTLVAIILMCAVVFWFGMMVMR